MQDVLIAIAALAAVAAVAQGVGVELRASVLLWCSRGAAAAVAFALLSAPLPLLAPALALTSGLAAAAVTRESRLAPLVSALWSLLVVGLAVGLSVEWGRPLDHALLLIAVLPVATTASTLRMPLPRDPRLVPLVAGALLWLVAAESAWDGATGRILVAGTVAAVAGAMTGLARGAVARRPLLRAAGFGAAGGVLGVAAGAPWVGVGGAIALGVAGAAVLGGASPLRIALGAVLSLVGAGVVAERIGLLYTGHPALVVGQLLPTVVVTLVAGAAGLVLRMTRARRRATAVRPRPPRRA